MVLLRHKGKGTEHVQSCNRLRRGLNALHLGGNFIPDLTEQVIFQGTELVLRVEDGILQLLQSGHGKPFRIGQRLLSGIVIGNQLQIGFGHLKIVTEHLIVFDFQIFDSRALPLRVFQLGKPGLSLRLGPAQVVHILVIALTDHAALTDGNGRLLLDGIPDQRAQIFQAVNLFLNPLVCRSRQISQHGFDGRQHLHGAAEGDQIPGIGRLIAHLAQQPLQIIDRIQVFPDLVTGKRVLTERLDRIQPLLHLRFFHQRLFEEGTHHSCAHGGLCLIKHPQKGASFVLLPQRLSQLQISSGGAVKKHEAVYQIGFNMGEMAERNLLRLI